MFDTVSEGWAFKELAFAYLWEYTIGSSFLIF